MMQLDFIRVDDRLIHGQILIKWLNVIGSRRVLVLDDETAENPILRSVMEMSLPAGIGLDIWGVDEGIEKLFNSSGNAFLLIKDILTIHRLFNQGVLLKDVHIGHLPYQAGKQKICEHMYLSGEECRVLGIMMNQGVNFWLQMVPDSEKRNLKEFLG